MKNLKVQEPKFPNSPEVFPSVDLAYEQSKDSYEIAQKRFEAVNDRAQKLIAFASSLTLAVPLFASSLKPNANFQSKLFIAALVFYLIGVVLSGIAATWGHLEVISPKTLFEGWLHYSEFEFKKNSIYWAGENLEANRSVINKKGNLTRFSALSFLIEVALLLAWVSF